MRRASSTKVKYDGKVGENENELKWKICLAGTPLLCYVGEMKESGNLTTELERYKR